MVALFVSLGKLPLMALTTWYARWWPLVIVAAGVLLVAEWGVDQKAQWAQRSQTTAQGATPPFRRSLGGGAVALLLCLIFVGITARTVHGSGDFLLNGLSINPDNIDEAFGEKYDREQQIDQAFPAGTSLAVNNPHGDVTVTGLSPDDRIHITVNKELYSSSEKLADDKATRLTPRLDLSGSVFNLNLPGIDGAISNLSITIPAWAQATVTADRGDVRISSLKAAVNVTSNRGDVQLDNIAGQVDARLNSSHSSFTSHGIGGDVSLKGRADNVSVTKVSGLTSVVGEFFGDTHFERLAGPVTFQTSRTHFSMAKLAGQIDISPDSELSASDLTGPSELRTRSRNISLQRVSGGLNIVDTNGTVDLTNVAPLGGIAVQNKNGSIHVSLPEHAGLTIDATARDGHVSDEFGPQAQTVGSRAELHATVGDGSNRISLETSNGDIALQREPASTAPASVESAPRHVDGGRNR